MKSETTEWIDYIESRYGPISAARCGCCFAAAVPVYGGVQIAIGGTFDEAVLDLVRCLQNTLPNTQEIKVEHSPNCLGRKKRIDVAGRDVTDLPGLWDESDTITKGGEA